MDAFDKLAKLAGASVESVGDGLPRTPAEAKALGVTRYFTGKSCLRGHVAERMASSKYCCECQRQHKAMPEAKERQRQRMRQYNAMPEAKERQRQRMRQYNATQDVKERQRQRMRQYNATQDVKERQRQRNATQEAKERKRQYGATPKRKEYILQYALSKCGDEILFAIRQAEGAARIGRVTADIIPQCPEPQRSQLQALVDRIKADPQAGKAVIGLLRTMRELRKAELAELRSEP